MRVIYMGTPDFAVPTLEKLVNAGHQVVAVYSQPPRPAGRGKALRPTPVHARAEALGLDVRTPVSLKDPEVQAKMRAGGTEPVYSASPAEFTRRMEADIAWARQVITSRKITAS